jgi:hypothetical protein
VRIGEGHLPMLNALIIGNAGSDGLHLNDSTSFTMSRSPTSVWRPAGMSASQPIQGKARVAAQTRPNDKKAATLPNQGRRRVYRSATCALTSRACITALRMSLHLDELQLPTMRGAYRCRFAISDTADTCRGNLDTFWYPPLIKADT